MPAPCITCDAAGRTIRTQGDARTDSMGNYVLCPHVLYTLPIGPHVPDCGCGWGDLCDGPRVPSGRGACGAAHPSEVLRKAGR